MKSQNASVAAFAPNIAKHFYKQNKNLYPDKIN